MNFLAHIFLSGAPGELMAGNFMADSVKGNASEKYSAGIREGIKMHRAIDTFTDTHPVVAKSKERLRKRFGKYAPVVGDVIYDHFLAAGWDQYSKVSLRQYTEEVYLHLKNFYDVFPGRTQGFYDYMVRYDVLYGYSKIEGIDRVMKGMARRAQFDSGMEHSAEELLLHYDAYKNDFAEFFPQMQQHIRNLAACRSSL